MGARDVVSRFRFREGTASSISVLCGVSSVLINGLLWANLEREDRVDRRELGDVALITLEVSCEILDVRIVKIWSSIYKVRDKLGWLTKLSLRPD